MKKTYIKLKNLTFSYTLPWSKRESLRSKITNFLIFKKNKQEDKIQNVFNKINLTIKPGDKIGLVGPNGSGKTTLLKLIGGIYHPDSGTIQVGGRVTSVFELGDGVNENLSGINNIKRILLLFDYKPSELERIEKAVIEFSELGDKIYDPIKTYSSGMKLRLQFSTAAFLQPDIFLLDEMFGMGDDDFRTKALKKVEELVHNSSIFIFSSHDKILLKRFCNKFIHINKDSLMVVKL